MPKELPEIVGATHIAFFVRWCIENSLMSQEVQENFAEELQRIANKELDCREFFFNDMDGVFTSEELNTKGEKFAAAYYHSLHPASYGIGVFGGETILVVVEVLIQL